MSLPLWTGAPRTPRRWQAEAVPVALAKSADGPALIDACTGAGKTAAITEIVWASLQEAGPREVVIVMTSRQSLVRDLAAAAVQRCGRAQVGRWYAEGKRWAPVVYSCYQSLEAVADQVAARGERVALLVCDEAHRLTSPAMWAQVHRLAPARSIALTATAYQSNGDPLDGWELAYSYRILDALREGVLVPPVPVSWDGDEVDEAANIAVIDMIRRHAPEGPGIVSALSIPDADWYAETLTEHGIPALSYHSGLTQAEQTRRRALLTSGAIRCLVHPKIMTEGVDIQSIRWIALRVLRSLRDLAQEVGRGLRSLSSGTDQWGAKVECIVLDPHRQVPVIDAIDTDPAVRAATLLELMTAEEREKAERKEAKEREKNEREIERVRRLDQLSLWCGQLRDRLAIAGWVRRKRDQQWRTATATADECAEVARRAKATKWLPEEVREAVRALVTEPARLTSGAASDLIDVLAAVSRRVWLHSISGGDPALGIVAQIGGSGASRDQIVAVLPEWGIAARALAEAWVERGWILPDELGTGRVTWTPAAIEAVSARQSLPPAMLWSWRWPADVQIPPLPGSEP